MGSLSKIFSEIRRLTPYLLLITFYFLIVNLQYLIINRKDLRINNTDAENKPTSSNFEFDDSTLLDSSRMSIPVLPFKED